ncbi:transcriptional regulator [Flavivirga aquatica]|uniref:Transcriptional regulator n=1 Tax=Flavivirga aquatica TaxID=1849968 RepID=A0A1E5TDD9_9FLAO|nr:response regulator [Flavivirga aquatica]OEK09370.1 transcriptional regulator [Flavivirga aquatica]
MQLPNIELACIIDDDGIYVNLVKKIIETKKLCKNLLIFNNGKESIEYFEALLQNLSADKIPEIIFLDLNMPIMDGWEFLKRFTKIKNRFNKQITLYIVSSSINPIDIDRAKSLSTVKDYLIKPVNIKELVNIFKRSA